MTSVVVDASAFVRMLAEDPADELMRRRIGHHRRLHAAAHVGAEVLNGLRGLMPDGRISSSRAEQAVEEVTASVWELRHDFHAYDGAYVAVARRLGLPLLTCDAKIAGAAPGCTSTPHLPTEDRVRILWFRAQRPSCASNAAMRRSRLSSSASTRSMKASTSSSS